MRIDIPWAEPNSGFTALMEALIIDWLKETSITAVARRMRLTWAQIDGVMQRSVRRRLDRRRIEDLRHIGVDETAFQRRHEYVTVVSNQEGSRVVYVANGRSQEALDGFWRSLRPEQLEAIESVAMDMCPAYTRSTMEHVPDAESKIAFDKLHVARAMNEGVNEVRKREHRELATRGETHLARTKYIWLKNPQDHSQTQAAIFELLKDMQLEVARAWAINGTARGLWGYASRGWALRGWKKWISWATRSRLEPMRRVARMVKRHLWGIIDAIVLKVTNSTTESINRKIQWIENNACGFRNRERFRNAIHFHCGNLDLYPAKLRPTHTTS